MFVIRSDGQFVFRFTDWKSMPWINNRTLLNEFREKLNAIPGLGLSDKDLDGKPIRPLDLLLDPSSRDVFKDAVRWLKHAALSTGT